MEKRNGLPGIVGWENLSPKGRVAMRKWYRQFRQHHGRDTARNQVSAQVWGVTGAMIFGWGRGQAK